MSTTKKRPSTFTFRKLTPERVSLLRTMIRLMRDGWAQENVLEMNRRDYGLTRLALSKLVRGRNEGTTTPWQRGNWLEHQLNRALEQRGLDSYGHPKQ